MSPVKPVPDTPTIGQMLGQAQIHGKKASIRSIQEPMTPSKHSRSVSRFGFASKPTAEWDRLGTLTNPVQHGNSWAQERPAPQSEVNYAAPIASDWPDLPGSDTVPSPPATETGFLRPAPLPPAIVLQDMALHEHLAVIEAKLTKKIDDSRQEILDRVLSRLDNLEEAVRRGQEKTRTELRNFREEMAAMAERSDNRAKTPAQELEDPLRTPRASDRLPRVHQPETLLPQPYFGHGDEKAARQAFINDTTARGRRQHTMQPAGGRPLHRQEVAYPQQGLQPMPDEYLYAFHRANPS